MADAERDMLTAIETLSVEAPIERVCAVRDRIENYQRTAREMKKLCDAAVIEWVRANGPITIGDNVTKTIKQEKSEKPRDKSHVPVMDAAFQAAGGSMELVAGLIASDGIKPGALKRLIGQEKFDELYETTWRDVLVDGKPGAKLVTVNTAFTK